MKILDKVVELYAQNNPIEDLIELVCSDYKARFCQQYVSGKPRYWFEFTQGRSEVTVGATETKEKAVAAFINCYLTK